ncbi:MAG: alpha/beta hydrolase, partial [Planctomycetaceae bacterium]|nr:alpha/beta hydrolase [Planctomycetaceae bacterium]
GPKYHHPAPLNDASRAVRYVRAHAEELKVDPHRVGIMGFSAGGHLASTVSTHYDAGNADSADPVAKQSSRPDFSILCYPVISLRSSFGHAGSRRNLLGENPPQELVESLSNETQINKETPPTFLFHTGEDKGVPVMNSIVYYQALVEHGVPAELHVYQQGPHGVGLAPKNPILNTWKDRLADWLKANNFLANAQRGNVNGKVSLNGEPLRWGTITFTPIAGGHLPASWAMISRGNYRFDAASAPVVGDHDVTVVNWGDVVPYPTLEDATLLTASQLRAHVATGENTFAFEFRQD